MGTVVGTLFFQQSDAPNNVVAVLFQSLFYSVVGAMTIVIKQFPERSIFYKQQDANFFPTWTYVVGRSVAAIPNAMIDAVGYGTFTGVFRNFVALLHKHRYSGWFRCIHFDRRHNGLFSCWACLQRWCDDWELLPLPSCHIFDFIGQRPFFQYVLGKPAVSDRGTGGHGDYSRALCAVQWLYSPA